KVHEDLKLAPVNSAYRDRIFLTGMFYIFLVGLCFFQMFSTIPVYYKEIVHLKESTIGWILAMNGLIIAFVEMVMVYKLENRRNPVLYMTLGALLIGIAFLTMYTASVLKVVVFSMILITFGEMLLFPFMNNFWVRRSTERNRGQYAAMYTMSFSAAIVLAPTFSSQVATWLGFEALWIINFFVCTFASVGFLLLKKRMTT
ncbi:MAG: MFS transporter, partial [Flavisolibacter sp.]